MTSTPYRLGCRYLLWAAALLLLVPSAALSQDNVRLATFNCEWLIKGRIHMKYGRTQAFLGQAAEQHFDDALTAVAEVIKRIDADILALTEIGPVDDVTALRARLRDMDVDYEFLAVCISGDTQTRQHVAVFAKRPLYDIRPEIPGRAFFDRRTDDPEDERETGISKGMSVTFHAAGKPVHLFLSHFRSQGGGHEADSQRVAQATILRRNIVPLLQDGAMVIVAGDLNAPRRGHAIQRLRGKHDIYEDLFQTGDARWFNNDRLEERWTYIFQGRRQQIDQVLMSYSVRDACQIGRSYRIVADTLEVTETLPGGKPASDHRPFFVDFQFRQ